MDVPRFETLPFYLCPCMDIIINVVFHRKSLTLFDSKSLIANARAKTV